MTTETTTPELEAAIKYRALLKARRDAADTSETLKAAYADAEAARTRLGQIEVEYRGLGVGV